MRCVGIIVRFSAMLTVIILSAQQKISAAPCPCDIYAVGGTPCVAAHSTARALLSSYNGPLYQVKRMSDNQTRDINTLSAGGYADAAAQDAFLQGTTGRVMIIYDQSGKNNHLTPAPGGTACKNPDNPSPASARITIGGGNKVYGLYMSVAEGYRNNATTGMPTGNQSQGLYWVVGGKRYGSGCCWDYGNAETNNAAGPTGLMNAIYFGNCSYWGTGTGNGPWMMADLEAGVFSGGTTLIKGYANNPSITFDYVTGMLKSDIRTYTLKYGNAQSGTLNTIYDGNTPTTWKLQGAIILGIGGDNSCGGTGDFYEGAITFGRPPDTTEDAVQRNIVAIYSNTTGTNSPAKINELTASPLHVRYYPSNANVVINYTLQRAQRVSVDIFDQHGRRIAAIVNSIVPAGRHEEVWNAKLAPAGVYVCITTINGLERWTGRIVIGKYTKRHK